MVQSLGWDSLHHRGVPSQGTMFCKIYMGHVGISLPPDVIPNERPSRAPNCRPFKHEVKVSNDMYKYSFYPKTIALWNDIPLSFTNIDNLDTFKSFFIYKVGLIHTKFNNYTIYTILFYIQLHFVEYK